MKGGAWLSGTRLGNEKKFYWFGHDVEMNYTNWHNGPDNGGGNEQCITPFYSENDFAGGWYDELCDWDIYYYICEFY